MTLDEIEIIDNSFSKIYQSPVPVEIKFGNANLWIAKAFVNYGSVVKYEDKENRRIVLKGATQLVSPHEISFTMTVDVKDDRYRVLMEQIYIDDNLYSIFIQERAFQITKYEEIKAEKEAIMAKWERDPKSFHYRQAKKNIAEEKAKVQRYYFLEEQAKKTISSIFNSLSTTIENGEDF